MGEARAIQLGRMILILAAKMHDKDAKKFEFGGTIQTSNLKGLLNVSFCDFNSTSLVLVNEFP